VSSSSGNNNSVACRAVSRQWLGKNVTASTDTHATIQVLLETVFSTRFVRRGIKRTIEPRRVSSVWESVKRGLQRLKLNNLQC
jgi:hypothetical protein